MYLGGMKQKTIIKSKRDIPISIKIHERLDLILYTAYNREINSMLGIKKESNAK